MAEDQQFQIPPAMVDASGIVVWTGGLMSVIVYNAKLVPRDKVPTGWESRGVPQRSGKITADTRPYTLGWLVDAWGEERFVAFAEKLKTNHPLWSTGTPNSLTRLAAGEFSLICGATVHSTRGMLKGSSRNPVGEIC